MSREYILDWLFGIDCPLECGRRIFGWRSHDCAKLAGKTSAEQVQIATDLARTVLVDMPADKEVHSAYQALDELDAAFPRGHAMNSPETDRLALKDADRGEGRDMLKLSELIWIIVFLSADTGFYWIFVLNYGVVSLKPGPLEPLLSVAISFMIGVVSAGVIWRKSEHP